MYQLIKDSLFSPKNMVSRINQKSKKTKWFIIILLALIALPNVLYIVFSYGYNRNLQNAVADEIAKANVINYRIEDGKLVSSGENPLFQVIKFANIGNNTASIPMYMVFDMAGDSYTVDSYTAITVVFTEDKIRFSYFRNPKGIKVADLLNTDDHTQLSANNTTEMVVKEISYSDLSIDFSKGKTNDAQFRNDLIKIGNKVCSEIKGLVLGVYIPMVVIAQIISSIFMVLILALLFHLLYRFLNITYKQYLKIVVLGATPYALCTLLATLFQSYFIQLLGVLITTIYIIRIMRYYSITHQKFRGDNNEL